MSYRVLGSGEPPPEQRGINASLPPDVAPTFVHEIAAPVSRERGWVAIPTPDMREYVKAQLLTAAAGFVVGMGLGAVFGNVIGTRDIGKKLTKIVRNRPRRRRTRRNAKRRTSRRRTSTRRRKRGRPSGGVVDEGLMIVTMDGQSTEVTVRRGNVVVDGQRYGSVYDLGTYFRAVPRGGEPRSYGTLAGAVKHVLRRSAVVTKIARNQPRRRHSWRTAEYGEEFVAAKNDERTDVCRHCGAKRIVRIATGTVRRAPAEHPGTCGYRAPKSSRVRVRRRTKGSS